HGRWSRRSRGEAHRVATALDRDWTRDHDVVCLEGEAPLSPAERLLPETPKRHSAAQRLGMRRHPPAIFRDLLGEMIRVSVRIEPTDARVGSLDLRPDVLRFRHGALQILRRFVSGPPAGSKTASRRIRAT